MKPDQLFPLLTPNVSRAIYALSGVEGNAVTLLLGESGVGKSYALDLAAERAPRRRLKIEEPLPISPHDLATLIRKQLVGLDILFEFGQRIPLGKLTEMLIEELVEDLYLVTIDDAHLLPRQSLEWLTNLCAQPEIHVALAGDPLLVQELPVELCQKATSIRFDPLPPAAVPETVEQLHPIWLEASPTTIELIDARFAQGNFRRWEEVTTIALEICTYAEAPFVTRSVAEHLLGQLETFDEAA